MAWWAYLLCFLGVSVLFLCAYHINHAAWNRTLQEMDEWETHHTVNEALRAQDD